MDEKMILWRGDASDKQALFSALRRVGGGLVDTCVGLWMVLCVLGRLLYRLAKAVAWGFWRAAQGFARGVRDVLNASNPRDE